MAWAQNNVLTMVVQGADAGVDWSGCRRVGALVAGRVLSVIISQTAPSDPLIFASVAALFVLSGIVACLIPARRATTVDPLIALRAD